jgi:hypothetical protein
VTSRLKSGASRTAGLDNARCSLLHWQHSFPGYIPVSPQPLCPGILGAKRCPNPTVWVTHPSDPRCGEPRHLVVEVVQWHCGCQGLFEKPCLLLISPTSFAAFSYRSVLQPYEQQCLLARWERQGAGTGFEALSPHTGLSHTPANSCAGLAHSRRTNT